MADIDHFGDDEVRALRAEALARRLAPFVAAAILVLLAAVGVWQYVKWRGEQRAQAVSARYFAADQLGQHAYAGGVLDRAAATKARDAFAAVAADAPTGVAVLANLHVAGLDAALGDAGAARQVWGRVAAMDGAPLPQRQLATLLDVQSRIGAADGAPLKAQLQPLVVPGAPWRALAQETEALIDLQGGVTESARTLLQQVAFSGDAPLGARQRAQGLLQTLPAPPAASQNHDTPVSKGGKGG